MCQGFVVISKKLVISGMYQDKKVFAPLKPKSQKSKSKAGQHKRPILTVISNETSNSNKRPPPFIFKDTKLTTWLNLARF